METKNNEKAIKFNYLQTEELKELIEKVYFENNNNGRKTDNVKNSIKFGYDSVFYKILLGMDYKVKLKNDIIDGSMLFDVKENDTNIELIPSSMFCIKEEGKYSFY
jgi:hypothetical protein